MLWGASVEAGYLSPYWMACPQAKERWAHVRKGERGNLVVYANTITKTEEQDDSTEEERKIPFMKLHSVFNIEQVEGLPEHYYTKPEPEGPGTDPRCHNRQRPCGTVAQECRQRIKRP